MILRTDRSGSTAAISRLVLPQAHLESHRGPAEVGGPYPIEKRDRIALPFLHAAQPEIGVLKVPRHADHMRIEDFVVAEDARMRVQHRAQEIAAGSGCIQDDESNRFRWLRHLSLQRGLRQQGRNCSGGKCSPARGAGERAFFLSWRLTSIMLRRASGIRASGRSSRRANQTGRASGWSRSCRC